jgi:hypothetical protein
MDDAVWDVTVFTKNRERQIAGVISQQLLESVSEHFQRSCKVGILLSHPGRKNKNAARVGHSNLTPSMKML